jgi:phosphoribosylanthranilate isomerase
VVGERILREVFTFRRQLKYMTWVKICGTTNLEDARTAVEAGADAVGFVFYEKSSRNISFGAAREIAEKLPERIEKIGVFVHGEGANPLNALLEAGLTGTQTYFSAASGTAYSDPKALGLSCLPKRARFLIALPMNLVGANQEQLETLAANFAEWGKNLPEGFPVAEGLLDTFVLDSGDLQQPGGTGKIFDWKKAVPIVERMRQGGVKLVVAGGLTAENVAEAIAILQPWGVDVASGVETRPGKKDPEKVRAFVKAVRDADRKVS